MAEQSRSRRRRRPPRQVDESLDATTTEEELPAVAGGEPESNGESPIQQEMQRRGLQSIAEGEDEPVTDMSDEDDEALVFGGTDEANLEDSAATFVGELPLEEEEALASGQTPAEKTEILQVGGGSDLDYPVLTIETADGGTSDVEVVKSGFILGRSPDSDVVIPDSLVSRHHAIIEQREDGWYVVDQNSGNGSFLNDERISDELLYDGDVIQLGDAFITFTAPGGEADQAPRLDATQMIPAAEGGLEGTGVTNTGTMAPAKKKNKKLLLIAVIVVALIGVAAAAKFILVPSGPSAEEIAAAKRAKAQAARNVEVAEAEKKFGQIKELVKQEKWTEALPMIASVEAVVPEAPIVKEYKEIIEREASASAAIEQARDLIEKKDFEAAVTVLAGVHPESMQIKATEELKKTVAENRLSESLDKARSAMNEKRFDDAIAVAEEVLQAFPGNEIAVEIRKEADKGKAEEARIASLQNKKRKRRPRPPKPPPKPKHLLLGQSLDSYRNQKIDDALAQASASGVSTEGVKTLRRFQSFYKQGIDLSKNPGLAPKAIKFLTKSLGLDKQLGGGRGAITEKLRKTLAKVYFLQGVDAHTRKKFPLAYKSFTSALKYNSGLNQANKRLKDLEIEAKKLFETAYVIKGSSPEKAVSHCQTVMGMVNKGNIYYGKCQKLVNKIRGPSSSSGSDGDGF